jgi:hypothetical protein
MSRRVWISAAESPDLNVGPNGLGPDWQLVGDVDMGEEPDLQRALKKSPRYKVDFYLDADPTSPWVEDLVARYPGLAHGMGVGDANDQFWLAIDVPFDQSRYVVTRRWARLASMERRPRESHPGRLVRTVPVGVRIAADGDGMFRTVSRD